MTYKEIVEEAIDLNRKNKSVVEKEFSKWTDNQLGWTPNPKRWNACECFEHLNLSNSSYLDAIAKKIEHFNPGNDDKQMKGGWIGQFILKAVQSETKKSPAPAAFQPKIQKVTSKQIETYLKYNKELQTFFEDAIKYDLMTNKLPSPAMPLPIIQLKLGDVIRIIVYHDKRHIAQAINLSKETNFPK